MLACLALRANTKTRCLADRRVAPIAIPECRNGSKAFDLLRAAFRHRGLSAVGKAAGHESRLRGPRKRPYGLHERKPQHWRSEAFGFRVCSCATKVAFVPRASDADRRSSWRGDGGRRSPKQSNPHNANGTSSRPSSHVVDAPAQAAKPRVRCAAFRGRAPAHAPI